MIKSIIAKKTDIVLVPQCHFLLSLNIIGGDTGSYLGPRAARLGRPQRRQRPGHVH